MPCTCLLVSAAVSGGAAGCRHCTSIHSNGSLCSPLAASVLPHTGILLQKQSWNLMVRGSESGPEGGGRAPSAVTPPRALAELCAPGHPLGPALALVAQCSAGSQGPSAWNGLEGGEDVPAACVKHLMSALRGPCANELGCSHTEQRLETHSLWAGPWIARPPGEEQRPREGKRWALCPWAPSRWTSRE